MVENVNVEVAVPPLDRLTLVVLKVTVRPAGVRESVRLTVPTNPLRLARVTVDVANAPCPTLRLLGLVLSEKSGTGAPFTVTEIGTE